MQDTSGIVADGHLRLLLSPWYREKKAAIEAQVRAEHAAAVSSTTDPFRRAALEDQIEAENKTRWKALEPSPQALWSSH